MGYLARSRLGRQHDLSERQLQCVVCVSQCQGWLASLLTVLALDPTAVQLPPFPDQVPEYGKFAGRVAAQFKGRVKAYEIWYANGMICISSRLILVLRS